MRPIDADALSRSLSDRHDRLGGTSNPVDHCIRDVLLSVIEDIEDAPTLDYAPVKHGEWKEGFCSRCGAEAAYNDIDEAIFDYDWEENLRYSHTETRREYHETPFCPNCGVKMDGGKKK